MFSLIPCFNFLADSFSCIILSSPSIPRPWCLCLSHSYTQSLPVHILALNFSSSQRLSCYHLNAHKHTHTWMHKTDHFLGISTQTSLKVSKTKHTVLKGSKSSQKFLPLFTTPLGLSHCYAVASQIYISFSIFLSSQLSVTKMF